MANVSMKLPVALNARLTAMAKRRGASKSAIMREALEAYLARGSRSKSASIAELAPEFIGCLDGGPRDLSSNRKHLKGFGQ
jgi:hypothetical protein